MGEIIKVFRGDEYVIIDADAFPGSKWERIGYRLPGAEPAPAEKPVEKTMARTPRRRRPRRKKVEE